MNKVEIKKVEERLGFEFNNKDILEAALTHSSFAKQYVGVEYNERLEFLGDAVLQLCVTKFLYSEHTDKSEGELTRKRALIVCENSLLEVSKVLGLGSFIRLSKGEEMTGGRERTSIQADCVEALIAAIYLDQGMEVADKFILNNFKSIITRTLNNEIVLDFKTRLQEVLQEKGEVSIEYELIKFEGPPHRRKFYTEVKVNDESMGEGEGYSKKGAEQNAAKLALIHLGKYHE